MNIDWGDGQYEHTAEQLSAVADVVVARAAIESGERVLDVGCGTGNGAIAAARAGGVVTGIDPSERLLDAASDRAREASLAIDWQRGEAAEPGVADGAFDAAIAVFSIIFAPDPAAAVAGVTRALRPGGRFVLTTWEPASVLNDSARVLFEALMDGGDAPPEPPWATPDGIRALLEPHARAVDIEERTLAFEAASARAWFDDVERTHPFWRLARTALLERDEAGYHELRERSIAVLEAGNEVEDGFRTTSRYRLVRADVAV